MAWYRPVNHMGELPRHTNTEHEDEPPNKKTVARLTDAVPESPRMCHPPPDAPTPKDPRFRVDLIETDTELTSGLPVMAGPTEGLQIPFLVAPTATLRQSMVYVKLNITIRSSSNTTRLAGVVIAFEDSAPPPLPVRRISLDRARRRPFHTQPYTTLRNKGMVEIHPREGTQQAREVGENECSSL